MSLFTDLLDDFRHREDHEVALQLLLDKPLMKYCGLWRATLVTLVHGYPIEDTWNGLWDCVIVDYKRLSDLADEPEGRARFQFNRLRELQLIYPDGTRTAMATKAIIKFMTTALS